MCQQVSNRLQHVSKMCLYVDDGLNYVSKMYLYVDDRLANAQIFASLTKAQPASANPRCSARLAQEQRMSAHNTQTLD